MKKKQLLQSKKQINAPILICAWATLIYCIIIVGFYFYPYYAPDFSYYSYMASLGSPAKDGFSSLFLAIVNLGNYSIIGAHLLAFGCMAFSMFAIPYSFVKLNKSKAIWPSLLAIIFVFSCGCFYYLYGKLFYDFPFSIANMSVSLLLLVRIFDTSSAKYFKAVLMLFVFSTGLCLSWKPYNIFMVAGLYFLILCNHTANNIFFAEFITIDSAKHILIKWCNIGLALLSFTSGYLLGNFGLILKPQETIAGLRAYPASKDFWSFLFSKGTLTWDHVNMLPFSISTISVFSVLIILFLLPIAQRKFQYLFVSAFMTACLYIFISHCSPGYPWHGFCFGVFVIMFLFALLIESQEIKGIRKKIFIFFVIIAISLQCVQNFFYYIPKQVQWFQNTQSAITLMKENSSKIFEEVDAIASHLDGTFKVDCAVKRITTIDQMGVYPLEEGDWDDWNNLKQKVNYSKNPDYTILVMPNIFEKMNDVVQQPGFNNAKTSRFGGYKIIVYKNL